MNDRTFIKAVQKYSGSFMNDTKWLKLIDSLTDQIDEVFITYKLIYDNTERCTWLDSSDPKPFFIEPILYKEVEWVLFPATYEDYVSRNNKKAGKAKFKQDIRLIEEIIKTLGQFSLEISPESVKLYAYR